MGGANTITVAYAEAMLFATPTEMWVEGKKAVTPTGLTQENRAKMSRKLSTCRVGERWPSRPTARIFSILCWQNGELAMLLENSLSAATSSSS